MKTNSIWGGTNLLSRRISFSGMLKVVLSHPPSRDQPYIFPQHKVLGFRNSALVCVRPSLLDFLFSDPHQLGGNYNRSFRVIMGGGNGQHLVAQAGPALPPSSKHIDAWEANRLGW